MQNLAEPPPTGWGELFKILLYMAGAVVLALWIIVPIIIGMINRRLGKIIELLQKVNGKNKI